MERRARLAPAARASPSPHQGGNAIFISQFFLLARSEKLKSSPLIRRVSEKIADRCPSPWFPWGFRISTIIRTVEAGYCRLGISQERGPAKSQVTVEKMAGAHVGDPRPAALPWKESSRSKAGSRSYSPSASTNSTVPAF